MKLVAYWSEKSHLCFNMKVPLHCCIYLLTFQRLPFITSDSDVVNVFRELKLKTWLFRFSLASRVNICETNQANQL